MQILTGKLKCIDIFLETAKTGGNGDHWWRYPKLANAPVSHSQTARPPQSTPPRHPSQYFAQKHPGKCEEE